MQLHTEGPLLQSAGNRLAQWPGTAHLGPQDLRRSPASAPRTAFGQPEPLPVVLVTRAVWTATVWGSLSVPLPSTCTAVQGGVDMPNEFLWLSPAHAPPFTPPIPSRWHDSP